MTRFIFTSVFFCSAILLTAQSIDNDWTSVQQQTYLTNRQGMAVLGSWAIANIATGIIGSRISDNTTTQRFHQMNAGWNLVNLGLAGLGFYQSQKILALQDASALQAEQSSMANIFLINDYLDIAYIAIGGALVWQSYRSTKRSSMFRGFGTSLLLQGAFLLVFDYVMYNKMIKLSQTTEAFVSLHLFNDLGTVGLTLNCQL